MSKILESMRTSRRRIANGMLARWSTAWHKDKPTHVAVEFLVSNQEDVDAQYRQFLDERLDLPSR